ncbi:Arabinanase/levansucrase/invertase [Penicillium riverlandense]|uniref:Arabinanase/levansucrase/invertase n=1 Tax=Penicillium riverlandense TaxID=1903569 RepID=UPI00254756B9|nr:Arabinanase/levansucrase/invertase [Penicillium riverlandense]KAJ5811306.1 Arabinanase/levansucrase/invertase [Penicillium riverlandense]
MRGLEALVPTLLGLFSHVSTVVSHAVPPHSKAFTNPVIYSDFADNDIFLGPDGQTFYFMASNMQYSPGAPILKSLDLVNWELIAHAVPFLEFGPKYNMTDGQTAYNAGTWASSMRYRKSNGLWYWIGCIDFAKTYVYTAPEVTGPWELSGTIDECYYDCGLLIDTDDTMFVAYGNTNVSIAQLSADGLSQVQTHPVFNAPAPFSAIEGNRLYKKDGFYYVLDDYPSGATLIWRSEDIWSGWTYRILQDGLTPPVSGGSVDSQGSLIETPSGDWYFMSFTWAYPAGRLPILAPITWTSDGWPNLTTVDGGWGSRHELSPNWEWNHNPDPTKYEVGNGLRLWTTTVTDDLFTARNTLTHRLYGPFPTATIEIDFQHMEDGDRCGLAAFRDETSWIGIVRNGQKYDLEMVSGMTLNETNFQQTSSLGNITDKIEIRRGQVWLRGTLDARTDGDLQGYFSYSQDGYHFHPFGGNFSMRSEWEFFQGERWGIFNYATKQLGGSIHVSSFTQSER